jgi:hypothetical protein
VAPSKAFNTKESKSTLRVFESITSSVSCNVPFHVHRRTLIAISRPGTVEWGRRAFITDVPQVDKTGVSFRFVQFRAQSSRDF